LTTTATAPPDPDDHDLAQQFDLGLQQFIKDQAPLNMILAGRPGAGKSTLVNTIFGEDFAATGIGASVTKEIVRYARPGFPIAIYDTPGIELGRGLTEVRQGYLDEIRRNGDSDERRIHFALYCVGDLRFLEFEAEIVRSLAQEVPVFLVLTQCPTPTDEAKLELARKIEAEQWPVHGGRVLLTLAQPLVIAGTTLPAFGLATLVDLMYQVLPQAVARTLARHQRVSLALKRDEADKIVLWAAAASAAIAIEPIPVVDAIAISGVQFAMLGRISAVMGLTVDIKAVVGGIAGILGVSLAARQAARQIWKLFPGVGTAISAAMSAAITRQMGQAYISACSKILGREIAGEAVATDDVTAEIVNELRRLWGK
jgi:uncharacterized protein (DUF697 family)/GTPase SAR1 family protein